MRNLKFYITSGTPWDIVAQNLAMSLDRRGQRHRDYYKPRAIAVCNLSMHLAGPPCPMIAVVVLLHLLRASLVSASFAAIFHW